MRYSPRTFFTTLVVAALTLNSAWVLATDIAQEPLFTQREVRPLNLLVMGRDHKIYYEAYNDASDLDGDGIIDIRYKPSITYFGYFSSNTCYDHNGSMFIPVSRTVDAQYRCLTAGQGEWSGNFLNYIGTSRIDALRKVLYGGLRSTDTVSTNNADITTVLERSYVPQDGHSWGKEYASIANDGYNIADYTPFGLPDAGRRHLFASVNLSNNEGLPLIRVLRNANRRIWEWVSKESPVAGDDCGIPGSNCVNVVEDYSHPGDDWWENRDDGYREFNQLENIFASNVIFGPVARSTIDKRTNGAATLPGAGQASQGEQENYISILTGTLRITRGEYYCFTVNGDDAVDFELYGKQTVGWYGGHGAKDVNSLSSSTIQGWNSGECSSNVYLSPGEYSFKFRHEEVGGGDSYQLAWGRDCWYDWGSCGPWSLVPASNGTSEGLKNVQLRVLGRRIQVESLENYTARVQVCKNATDANGRTLLEDNCKAYIRNVSGTEYRSYKPEGILQDYGNGVQPRMLFGLLTGSHVNNLKGGVLRREVSNISDEINQEDGRFTAVNGVINTINKLKVVGFNPSNRSYAGSGCGLLARAINNNECHAWGNPLAEMMYEGIRYFAGKTAPTATFNYVSSTYDTQLGLPVPSAAWTNPYSRAGIPWCASPVQTLISDINPSYDTDDLPGSHWNSGFVGDIAGLNVGNLADSIWTGEFGGPRNIFIGETSGIVSPAPNAKSATTFKNTRGLAPEEPTKQGGYYSASLAYYGRTNDLNSLARGAQKLSTYSIALSSPLPEFRIPVGGGNFVTLVPFGKSVDFSSDRAAYRTYSPTNTLVDFYVESIAADGRSGTFRVNFEDVEQGNDHDMDAIARYQFRVNADNTVTVEMFADYASGGIIQHLGYVISGTTRDGLYLDIRDSDTAAGSDYAHPLDTPPGVWAGGARGTAILPQTSSRTFTPSNASAGTFLKDPLWYAAKWGGFKDKNGNNRPDLREEWTSSTAANPNPDNYFLVTNALRLRDQLDTAFSEILRSLASSSSAAASAGQFVDGDTQVVQARFRTSDWSGELIGFEILQSGEVGDILWNSASLIPAHSTRKMFTLDDSDFRGGREFKWSSLSASQQALMKSGGASDPVGEQRVNYIRGNASNELRNGGLLRDRENGVLADIINSDPVYVDSVESRLSVVPSADADAYNTFRAGLSVRPDMVYTGTNGGYLHAVCAGACPAGKVPGTELFAYVPQAVMSKLHLLASPSYTHQYYVDGSISVSDAKISSQWKTVLVGALGAGGKGVYALDVTNPTSFSDANVLWEFTPAREAASRGILETATDLGLTIGKPHIARLEGNRQVVILANGYNGAAQKASLMVLNLETGELLARLQVSGSATALASPTLLDYDQDGDIDYAYAGDDIGRMWRFDLTSSNVAAWSVSLGGQPLFDAGNTKPITTAPTIHRTTDNKIMVIFGTGRYLGNSDKTSLQVQTLYGIQDKSLEAGGSGTTVQASTLVQQTVTTELETALLGGGSSAVRPIRVTSANAVDYSSKNGWFLNLLPPSPGAAEGERVTSVPILRHGRVVFTTLIPPSDACEFGGSGWLMELDALTGSRLTMPVLDVNEDGEIDADDNYTVGGVSLVVSGTRLDELIRTPAVIGFGGDKEAKYVSGSGGGLTAIMEKGGGNLKRGRLSWQQLE